jgi:hypothetical protein
MTGYPPHLQLANQLCFALYSTTHAYVSAYNALLDRGHFDIARHAKGHHDFVAEAAFLHRANSVTGVQALTGLAGGYEGSLLGQVERGDRRDRRLRRPVCLETVRTCRIVDQL